MGGELVRTSYALILACLRGYQMYARLTRRRAETTAPSGTRRLANTRSESLARASIHHRYFLTDGASEKDLIASGRMTARPSSQRDSQISQGSQKGRSYYHFRKVFPN